MTTFIEIIDTYLFNYSTYKNGKVTFECEYGELVFYKNNSKIVIVHGIYIFPEYRWQGYCKGILQYLIDSSSPKFEQICVQSVLSKILYAYLLRFEYKNKKFTLQKNGFYLKL